MKMQDVDEINDLMTRDRVIEAIKALRYVVPMGLKEAKDYLDPYRGGGPALIDKLCGDFLEDKEELLKRKVAELHKLENEIMQLRREIHGETTEPDQTKLIQSFE